MLRGKSYWMVAGTLAVFLASILLAVRAYQRHEFRQLLNEDASFSNPALEVTIPRFVMNDSSSKKLLEPGARTGLWILEPRKGGSNSLEVRLTDRGLHLFSVVGNQIVATFRTGHREATAILDITKSTGSRSVRFRYSWLELHPGIGLLGTTAPEIGMEYEGEALLNDDNGRWKLLQWTTPLEEAMARFHSLNSH